MMILICRFDSPFVRRVGVSLKLLDLPFEHRNWSVGRDQARIREHNPLGRVPTLVIDDGETLMESGAILDYLDDHVGPERALLPPRGAPRRTALRLMAIATGAAEKAVAQIYEVVFRPDDKRHAPWVRRCREQMDGAFAELERACAALPAGAWLVGARMTQADITVACAFTFASEALRLPADSWPALRRHVARCEALPAFAALHERFHPPSSP